jgi:anaerobic ribonucleoside-triphosphate reductase
MKPATKLHKNTKKTDSTETCACAHHAHTVPAKQSSESCACTAENGACNKETQVYSRVVGYIRPTDHWNVAKKEEFEHRKTYKMPKDTEKNNE